MPNDETALSGEEQLKNLVQETQKEYRNLQNELKEIDILIRQSTAEVDTLAQRNTRLTNRVRQMEMGIDTYPRSDIKEIYGDAHEAQMRLFMMRGQLEQLQNRQQNLQQQSKRLLHTIELANQISPVSLPGTPSAAAASNQSTVVRIIEAQENERQRLARQIHDGPAQSLTNLILQAEICERLFDRDPAEARVELANLRSAVITTFQKIREFIMMLRPMMLDDLGLVPALKQYIEDYEEKTKLSVNFAVIGRDTRLPPYSEVTVFRMVQELLTNVQKHARASHVQVAIDFQDDKVVASVEDDGSGFDAKETQTDARHRKGLGLPTMQERTEMLGGHVQVESSAGRGTKVRIEIPSS